MSTTLDGLPASSTGPSEQALRGLPSGHAHGAPLITRLVLLGATGDLAGRFLLPALARGMAAGELPEGLQVVAAAHQDWDDETFRDLVAHRLQQHAADVPAPVRQALLGAVRYRRLDLEDPGSVAAAVHGSDGNGPGTAPVAVYLALPPALFPAALDALGAVSLPPGSRIAVEKPFGEDLDSAVTLNALLARVGGGADEAVFRVDHVLGMPRVRALPPLRAPGGVLEPVWDGAHLRQVEVLWEETLGLEGRADFYDRAGALRDVVQNHLLQVLALLAMELPPTADERDLHAAKSTVLRSVRQLSPAATRRGRYTAGTLAGGVPVPGYADEPGVDPARSTETFAELVLELDTPRWVGTRFVLRAGKALAADRKGVLLHLRGSAPAGDRRRVERVAHDQLWIDLDGPAESSQPGGPAGVPGESAAYGRVLTDLLGGGSRTSVSGEEAEQAWRIVEPVLGAWADGSVPLLEYAAGSPGPSSVSGRP